METRLDGIDCELCRLGCESFDKAITSSLNRTQEQEKQLPIVKPVH